METAASVGDEDAGEKLQHHYRQAFDYWLKLVPQRPRYVVLCNFDKFWVYDFDLQLEDSVDKVALDELPERYAALNFLFPDDRKPQFGNNRVAVTRAAADKVAHYVRCEIRLGEQHLVPDDMHGKYYDFHSEYMGPKTTQPYQINAGIRSHGPTKAHYWCVCDEVGEREGEIEFEVPEPDRQ